MPAQTVSSCKLCYTRSWPDHLEIMIRPRKARRTEAQRCSESLVVIASDYFVSSQPSAGLQPCMRHGVGIGVACRNCQCTTTGETQVLLRVHVQVLFHNFIPLARQGPRTGRRAANNLIPAASGIEDVSVDNNPVVPAGPRPQV